MRNIVFHKETKTFHLYNDKISYIMCVLKNGHMGHLYFGKRIHDKSDFSYLVEECQRPMTSCIYEGDRIFLWSISGRNIRYTGQRITDILQLKYCKKMEVESQNLCMKDMRLQRER